MPDPESAMTLRRLFFWFHLCLGSIAGLVILIMSVTGVLLTYVRQINSWADHRFRHDPPRPGVSRLPLETLLSQLSDPQPSALTLRSDPASPAAVEFGRDRLVYINPYTGNVLGEASQSTRLFFRAVEQWHRRLGAPGGSRDAGRAITGISNLVFLLLVCSGFYLWLPKKWTWQHARPAIWFRKGLRGKARNWSWHNTVGIWCAVPLFVITLTGVVMSFPWANALLFRMTGNEPPVQREGREGRDNQRGGHPGRAVTRSSTAGLNSLWTRAEQQVPGWKSITLRMPLPRGPAISFAIDAGDGGRPDLRSTLTLDRKTGAVVKWETFQNQNKGRQLRSWVRFSHTGEAGGIIAQTAAGLASAGGAMLAWTGLALAFRRFINWRTRAHRRDDYAARSRTDAV
jgi:uncharacterized iron-regulated membrane protein